MKKTKIICTIGPKSESIKNIKMLIKNGMDIARLNLSHGDYEEHYKRIKNLRYISNILNKNIPILIDTKGPEIRIMKFKNTNKVYLKKNQIFRIVTYYILGNNEIISVNYDKLCNYIKLNDKIVIDDGKIIMNVINIKKILGEIVCIVINSGFLEENKNLHIKGSIINIPYLNNKDENDILFACKNNVDIIAMSFVRDENDIFCIRDLIKKFTSNKIFLISKIENKKSIKNIDKIIKNSDGIMIARGDLGVEIPLEKVTFEQKKIIKKCNINSKPVITATHMLESMIYNDIPTRAESGDVYNAILDNTDSVMLSAETANGKNPIKSVKILNKICNYTDNICLKKIDFNNFYEKFIFSIVNLSNNLYNRIIVIYTNNYNIVKNIRKYNKTSYIINIFNSIEHEKKLIITKGVFCYKINNNLNNDNFIYEINNIVKKYKFIKKYNSYIILYNNNLDDTKNINSLQFIGYLK